MPRVPEYGGPQALPSSLPQVRQTSAGVETLGAVVREQNDMLRQGVDAVAKQVDIWQIEQNETATKNALAEYQRGLNDLWSNPETGFSQTRGETAREAQKPLGDARKALRDRVSAGLSPRAREMFEMAAMPVDTGFDSQVGQHVGTQHFVAMKAASEARMEVAQDSAALNFNPIGDNTAFNTHMATLRAEAADYAEMAGLPADAAAAFVDEKVAGAHAGVIQHLISNRRATDARAYFAEHKDEIKDAELRDRASQAIEQAVGPEESLALALRLQGMGVGAAQAELDRLFKAGEITADVHKGTRSELEHRDSQRRQREAEWMADGVAAASSWLFAHPGASVNQLPPNLHAAARAAGALDNLDRQARTGSIGDDTAVWAEVLTAEMNGELAGMTPVEFRAQYTGKLSQQRLEQGMAMVARAGGQELTSPAAAVVSTGDRIKTAAANAGIVPITGKPSPDQAQAFARFEMRVAERVRLAELSRPGQKRAASPEEIQQAIDAELLDQVRLPRMFGADERMPVGALTGDQLQDAYVMVRVGSGEPQRVNIAEIPVTERKMIYEAFRRRGVTPTEAEIAAQWVRGGRRR